MEPVIQNFSVKISNFTKLGTGGLYNTKVTSIQNEPLLEPIVATRAEHTLLYCIENIALYKPKQLHSAIYYSVS